MEASRGVGLKPYMAVVWVRCQRSKRDERNGRMRMCTEGERDWVTVATDRIERIYVFSNQERKSKEEKGKGKKGRRGRETHRIPRMSRRTHTRGVRASGRRIRGNMERWSSSWLWLSRGRRLAGLGRRGRCAWRLRRKRERWACVYMRAREEGVDTREKKKEDAC